MTAEPKRPTVRTRARGGMGHSAMLDYFDAMPLRIMLASMTLSADGKTVSIPKPKRYVTKAK